MTKNQKLKIAASLWIVVFVVVAINTVRYFVLQPLVFSSEMGMAAKTKGEPDAPIQIIEYSDFQCPACSHGAAQIKQLIEQNDSVITITYRHLPLMSIHPHALEAGVFAECAAQQDRFWPMHDRLFETQKEWHNLDDVRGRFLDIAREQKMDLTAMKHCIEDPEVEVYIRNQKKEATEKGIRSTPTYIINGEMKVGTKGLKEKIQKVLDEFYQEQELGR